LTITIVVTHFVDGIDIFWSESIIIIDRTVSVVVPSGHDISGKSGDLFTSPSNFTFGGFWSGIWTVTIDMTVTWTVNVSPVVFVVNNTLVSFTSSDGFITVIVTVLGDSFEVFFRPLVIEVNNTIIIGIPISNSIIGH